MAHRQEHLTVDELKVLTVRQWCELNNISFATGRRILKSGNGPKIIQLSSQRIGIRVGDNRAWQEQRVRA